MDNASSNESFTYPSHFLLQKKNEFVLFTMPKTGTHLMAPFLEKLTNRIHVGENLYTNLHTIEDYEEFIQLMSLPDMVQVHWWLSPVHASRFSHSLDQILSNGQFLLLHAPYSYEMERVLEERNCVVFHVVRDPRDYAVSMLNYLRKKHNMLFSDPIFRKADSDTQLFSVIAGTHWHNSAHMVINNFIGWMHSPVCCVLRYEKLMGPMGGACSKEEQIIELRKIPKALNIEIHDFQLLQMFSEVYGTGDTFHKGTPGAWKTYFKQEHKELFKQLLGDVLINLGYEKDYNW